MRYNADGSLDAGFDGDGKLTTPIGTNSVANAIALQADGKIVVAGSSSDGSIKDFAVLRLRGDNRAPQPAPTTMTLLEDTPLSVPRAADFYDPDSDMATTELLYAPAHGASPSRPTAASPIRPT